MTKPVFVIVSGPNGAGKSTLTRRTFAESGMAIIDPDAIARELNPNDPAGAALPAGRQATAMIAGHIERGESFVQETTLSGIAPIRAAERAKAAGYRIEQYFVGLNDPAKSHERVADRVARGGHDIPAADIARRFHKTFRNAERLAKVADSSRFYDNSDPARPHQLVLTREGDRMQLGPNPSAWAHDLHDRLRDHDLSRSPDQKPIPAPDAGSFEYRDFITRDMLRSEPDTLFVFGDNMQQRGFGGQAKEMRGEPNAVGIPTKNAPSMQRDAFFSDQDFDAARARIDAAGKRLRDHLNEGKRVVWPKDGIGTGRADLASSAPRIWQYIEKWRGALESHDRKLARPRERSGRGRGRDDGIDR